MLTKHQKATMFAVGVAVGIIIAGLAVCTGTVKQSVNETAPSKPTTEAREPDVQSSVFSASDVPATEPATIAEFVTDEEKVMLAQLLWGEARGVESETEQAAVIWCVLNRVDATEYPDTVSEVITQRSQFNGYKESYPVKEHLLRIVEDVVARWSQEKLQPGQDFMRVLPAEYTFFSGDGTRNYFRDSYIGGNTWNWILPSPYES